MRQIEIFSYFNCFKSCKKMRPGFATASGIWCLTHTKPVSRYITIPAALVKSDHFKGRGSKVFITKALETAHRYNNVPGGMLLIEERHINFLTLNNNTMSKTVSLLNLSATEVASITREELGLNPEGEQVQVLCYDAMSQMARGEELSEEIAEMTASPKWSGVVSAFQRAELAKYQTSPDFPFYHTAEVSPEDVEMTLQLIQTAFSGNPTEEGTEAHSAVELLADTFGPLQNPESYAPVSGEELESAVAGLFSEEDSEEDSEEATLPVPAETALPAAIGQFGLKAAEMQTTYDSLSEAEKSIKLALAALQENKDIITRAALRTVADAAGILDAKAASAEILEIEA